MRIHLSSSVAAFASALLFSFAAFAQTNVVTNGSFETGLTGWTQTTADGGTGTCSYNAAIVTAPETLTLVVPGLAPTNGTVVALGSVHLNAPGRLACYLYQDVAIPAGATTATLSGDLGVVLLNSLNPFNMAIEIGLYPASNIPTDEASRIGNAGIIYRQPSVSDTALHSVSGTFNVSSVAGQNARLIIINVIDSATGTALVGIDNIKLLVSVTPPPTVTAVSPGSGLPAGGTAITITGTGFTGATGVTVGEAAASSVIVVSDTSVTAITPAGMLGTASVVVNTPGGSNVNNTLYTYASAPAPGAPPPLQISYSGSVNLQAVQNEVLMVSGTAGVLANQGGYSWQATTTTPWLTLIQFAGSFPGAVAMTANAAGLAAGTYNGSVTVVSGGVTVSIPVVLTVLPAQSVTANPAAVSFSSSYPGGGAAGYDIQMGPAGVAFSAKTSGSSSGWLSISPSSGIGPATIHVSVDASKASPGSYQDSIAITSPGAPNSPLSIPVRLSVSGLFITLPQEINSATGAGTDHTVAPNEIVSLFPADFSCSSQPVVSINGTPVGWSSYVPGQINYAVPSTVTSQAILSLACNGAVAWSFSGLAVAATMPGIFTTSTTGSGPAAAANADGTLNSASNAAARGTYVSLYVSGFGVFNSAGASGLRNVAGAVTAQIGGVATTVQYAGEAPGNTDGLQQINLLIPANSPTGSVPVMLWVNGTPTQTTVTLSVR